MDLWIVWLILIIVLSFFEAATINLVSIWFIVSGFISLILSFFDIPFWIQFAVFVIVGILLMLITKPFIKRVIKPHDIKTNFDRVIGMTGVVTEEISKNKVGEVKVDGKTWSAVSQRKISIGEEVIIDEIDGVKLKVHKLDSEKK